MQQAVITGGSGTVAAPSTGHESLTLTNTVEMPGENIGVSVIGQIKSVPSPELLQEPEQTAPAQRRKTAACEKEIHVPSPKGGHARPRTVAVSPRISTRYPDVEYDIPLYLIPHVIALGIRKQGESVFRISVIRKKQHLYTIRIRTKKKERRHGKKTQVSDNKKESLAPDP